MTAKQAARRRKLTPGWQVHQARTCNVYFAGRLLPVTARAAQAAGISVSRLISEVLAEKLRVKIPPRKAAVSIARTARTFKRRMKKAAVLLKAEAVLSVRCAVCHGRGTDQLRGRCQACRGRGTRRIRRST